VAVALPPIGWVVPWIALAAWWAALLWFRRGRPWLRSPPLATGLVIATLFADASVVVASMRMSTTAQRSFAAFILWIAALLSITTFTLLRTPPDEGGDTNDDGGSPVDHPEPPWWPDFERDFRDYARRVRRPRPRTPAGRT
jgi:hypothetical protein